MGIFERDLSYGDESVELAIPIVRKLYPEIVEFKRIDKGAVADREISTDVLAKFPDRDETWAFKARRPRYRRFDDITIELMNGTGERGDYYRFKGGVVKKYVYFWRTNGTIQKLLVLDAKKLVDIPIEYWNGNLRENFPGLKQVPCYKNKVHGSSYLTSIDVSVSRKYGVILNDF